MWDTIDHFSLRKYSPEKFKNLTFSVKLLVIHGVHVLDELQNLVGVAHLVVVPGHDLYEGVGQGDAGSILK